MRDAIAMVASLTLAVVWLKLCNAVRAHGMLSTVTARKVIHIGTGPLFLVTWIFFSEAYYARIWAALVPILITTQFVAVGTGMLRDDDAVQAMSRSGRASELLRGPLLYGIVFVGATILGWRNSSAAMASLCILCAGDGAAELVGRRWGTIRLPWSPAKSVAGSTAMFVAGFIVSALMLGGFAAGGYLVLPPLGQLAIVVAVATAVESLPLADVDNVTVAVAGVATALFLGWH